MSEPTWTVERKGHALVFLPDRGPSGEDSFDAQPFAINVFTILSFAPWMETTTGRFPVQTSRTEFVFTNGRTPYVAPVPFERVLEAMA